MIFLREKLKEVYRRHSKMAAYAVMGVSLGVLLGLCAWKVSLFLPTNIGVGVPTDTASSTGFERSRPLTLRIPKINLETNIVTLGLNADGTIEVPKGYTEVGWYKNGPTPGEIGPAVILGHVDSYKGPAVFYHLGELQPGDQFEVVRKDGTTATFEVTESHRYSQNDFPTQLVYGDIPYAGIRLITCTGIYDHGIQRYSHNLVVYGKLVEENSVNTEN